MGFQYCLAVITLAVTFVAANQPHPEIVLDTINSDILENPYIESISAELYPGGQMMTLCLNTKDDLPDDLVVDIEIVFNGQAVIQTKNSVCDTLDDEIAKTVLKYAVEKFPKECPFTKAKDLCINKYVVDNDKLPPDTKPGSIQATTKFYQDEEAVYGTVIALGEIVIVT